VTIKTSRQGRRTKNEHMKLSFFSLIILLLVNANKISAQVVMVPQLTGVGLVPKQVVWNVLITSASQETINGKLRITVKERSSDIVYFDATSGSFSISTGANLLNESAAGAINVEEIHYQVSNTGFFPAGYYTFCFELTLFDGKTAPVTECLPVDVEAMVPPMLVTPEDSAVLPDQYPVFTWVPPAPINIFPILLYDFILVEQYPGQPKNEAIQRNSPVIGVFNLTSPVYPVAASGTQLDTGKTYVWQVIARNGDTYGAKTEAWSFRLGGLDTSQLENFNGEYYIQLSGSGTLGTYPLKEDISFTIFNETNDNEVQCSLLAISNGGQQVLANQTIKLQAGRNYLHWKHKLNVSGQSVLLLRIALPSGKQYTCYLLKS
jgi:hypothetical protein